MTLDIRDSYNIPVRRRVWHWHERKLIRLAILILRRYTMDDKLSHWEIYSKDLR